jgi:hypothetical protein
LKKYLTGILNEHVDVVETENRSPEVPCTDETLVTVGANAPSANPNAGGGGGLLA